MAWNSAETSICKRLLYYWHKYPNIERTLPVTNVYIIVQNPLVEYDKTRAVFGRLALTFTSNIKL